MATLLLNRGRIHLIKNVVKPLHFYLHGKTDMKYEVSVSELTPPPNFSLIPLKIKKLDFDPQNKLQRTSDDVINFIMVLIEFVTYFHTTKFGFN